MGTNSTTLDGVDIIERKKIGDNAEIILAVKHIHCAGDIPYRAEYRIAFKTFKTSACYVSGRLKKHEAFMLYAAF